MNKLGRIINGAERIVLLYHIDTDGICSAKIVSEALSRLNKKVLDFFPSSPKMLKDNGFQESIRKDEPDLVVIVDVGVEENEPLIVNNPGYKFVILDHHQITKDLSDKRVVHVNPKIKGDERFIPASKICFDEMSKIIDIKDLDWVSAVGVIGDSGAIENKAFINKTLKKYGFKPKDDKDYYFDSYFGELSNLINGAKMCKGNDGAEKALRILQESGDPHEFYNNAYELREYYNEVQDYLNEMVDNFEKYKEKYDNLELSFYVFAPKYMIGSTMSTIVSFKHPHETIVIINKKGNQATANLRRHDKKYDMGMVSKNSVKGLKHATGGGHVPAAGANLYEKDINLFKRNIVHEIKRLMNIE